MYRRPHGPSPCALPGLAETLSYPIKVHGAEPVCYVHTSVDTAIVKVQCDRGARKAGALPTLPVEGEPYGDPRSHWFKELLQRNNIRTAYASITASSSSEPAAHGGRLPASVRFAAALPSLASFEVRRTARHHAQRSRQAVHANSCAAPDVYVLGSAGLHLTNRLKSRFRHHPAE